ncbi:MAG: hypothetical protein WCK78_05240 [Paludibacter sp.]
MKILKVVGWTSAAIGTILIIMGSIFQVFGMNPFHTLHNISNFEAGSSFLLLAIAIFIATKNCCQDGCCCKEEKPKE